ncbi:MAG TPA: M48 family metalloprotease [Pararhizobium sp.]|nr:M48 family metalloprotease [Pararhizobium sp.]
MLRRFAVAAMALALSGCQTFLDQSDPSGSIHPSATPQIVSEVQKNDPKAQLGAREHPRILATYGGEYHDAKTERLVARIVGALTAVSENPHQTYRITVLDSPSVNAFALPGGYIYVTRGLLALANDASEIAAVIAHEMGHVTANHGIERQRFEEAQTINQRVVNEVLSNELASNAALAQSKLKLAAFSRQQELQADAIGVHMLGEAGYDPYAAARFLETMADYSDYVAGDPTKDQSLDFLSTHPSTPQRVALARQHASVFGPEGVGDRGRDYFLDGIDGLLFGDRPQEGYVRGRVFLHPRLGVRFEVPPGFKIKNTAEAVLATGSDDLAIRVDGVDSSGKGSLTNYIGSGWVSGLQPNTIRTTSVNGLEAATARASADKWDFDVTVIRLGKRIYRILTAAPRGSSKLEPAAAAMRQSFRKLTPAEIASLKPLRVRVITVRPGDTVASLSRRMMGTDRPEALFRVLNALNDGQRVAPGQRVKIISQ